MYLLKHDKHGNLERIIAQGTLDARLRGGFRLLGAAAGDQIVLIGDTASYEPVILRGTIRATELTQRVRMLSPRYDDPKSYVARKEANVLWQPEECTPQPFPIIDVLPEALPTPLSPTAMIRVQVLKQEQDKLDLDRNAEIYVIPLDQATAEPRAATSTIKASGNVPTQAFISLDGHVFVEWKDTGRLMIATFSQGGGPPTGSPTNGAPITAGSSDGNLMIFFEDRGKQVYKNVDNAKVRVITTRQPGVAFALSKSSKLGAEPRGYAFSLSSNAPLPIEHHPTLVMAYDKQTELDDGEPIIHRMDDQGIWQPIPSYRPRGAWYVAAPLDEATAPGLMKSGLPENEAHVERFRIFLVRRRAPSADQAG